MMLPKFKGRYYILKLISKIFVVPKSPVIITIQDSIKIEVNPCIDRGVEAALFYNGTYEPGTIKFLKANLGEKNVFIDVGANIGLISLIAAKLVGKQGRVIAFEPGKETSEILRRNILLNGLKNIEVIQKALGAELGTAKLFDNWSINRGGASIVRNEDNEIGQEVAVSTLDWELNQRSIHPDVIKIDVEGYEMQVLMGSKQILNSLPKVRWWVIEISNERVNVGGSGDDIRQLLLSHSYSCYSNKKGKESNSKIIQLTHFDWARIKHDNVYFKLEI